MRCKTSQVVYGEKSSSFTGPGSQPSIVEVSGVSIERTSTFTPGQTTVALTFFLTNDEIGLEDDEVYQLSLTDPSQPITIGQGGSTTIIIADDEGKSFYSVH